VPLRNRVTPLGELVAHPGRGLLYGNRGCLHDARGRIARGYAGKRWISCRLEFKGWLRRPLVQPGRFTELFFLDEATAFAAGHRPCALCRREDYNLFAAHWRELHGGSGGADEIDARLHDERLDAGSRAQRHHVSPIDALPDGAFVLRNEAPWAVLGGSLHRWSAAGYDREVARPRGDTAVVVTPPSLVEILRRGWHSSQPLFHPSTATRRLTSARSETHQD
jgi:hypothetical protein